LVVPWFFHDLSAFSQHFPAVFCGSPLHRCPPNRCRTTTWAEARAWERTPEPPKRARCVGWFAWRRKWGPPGDGLVGGGFSSNFICFL
jgi:hypothetical protein